LVDVNFEDDGQMNDCVDSGYYKANPRIKKSIDLQASRLLGSLDKGAVYRAIEGLTSSTRESLLEIPGCL
jgi:hypothetical protein